jgi:hypothetical protein
MPLITETDIMPPAKADGSGSRADPPLLLSGQRTELDRVMAMVK